jgi:hypothetical protein
MNEKKANQEFLPGDEVHDVQGHASTPADEPEPDQTEEDVEGHVQPRRDLDIERI